MTRRKHKVDLDYGGGDEKYVKLKINNGYRRAAYNREKEKEKEKKGNGRT